MKTEKSEKLEKSEEKRKSEAEDKNEDGADKFSNKISNGKHEKR